MLHSEFQKGMQRRPESQDEEKRNEKNMNPLEGVCITFRIPEGNSKLAKAKKKIKVREKPKIIGLYSTS